MSKAYLLVVLKMCDILLEDCQWTPDKTQAINDSINLETRSIIQAYELIKPLIFNFKHTIELYIKMLGNIDYGMYEETRDLKSLFESALKKTKTTQNHQILKNLYKITWPIIEKYYYGIYITGNKSKSHPDRANVAEKYPEYKNAYKISLEINNWVSRTLITEIKQDAQNLENFFAQAEKDIDIKPSKKFIYGRKRKNTTT